MTGVGPSRWAWPARQRRAGHARAWTALRAAVVLAAVLALGPGRRPVAADDGQDAGAWAACTTAAPADRLEVATGALARLRQATAGDLDRPEGEQAAQHLRLLGPAGRRVVACALAAAMAPPGPVAPGAWRWVRALLAVLADDEAPEVDEVLVHALAWPDGAARAIAADGLGHLRVRDDTGEGTVLAALSGCAADPYASVRWSALRSLMALPGARAEAARGAWPDAAEREHEGVRLQWHRRAGDRGPLVIERALRLWRDGASLDVRLEAAELLAQHDAPTEAAVLVALIDTLDGASEPGAARAGAAWIDAAVRRRRIAIQATITWWERAPTTADAAAERTRVLERAIEWTARPVASDPYSREPQPESRLWRWLPEAGPLIVAPVLRRLRANAFHDPRAGARLLAEQARPVALAALHELIRFARERMPERGPLLTACTGALVDLGRIEDEELATYLFLDPLAERWARADMVRVLRRDPSAWVVSLLQRALEQGDAALRSEARRALEGRREEAAHDLLVEAFFKEPFDFGHDRLAALVAAGDARARAVLERALRDERDGVVLFGLQQVNPRARRLHTTAVLDLIRPLGARVTHPLFVQAYVYALLVLAPEEAVAWVARRWEEFASDEIRANSLRILQEVRGEAAEHAAIDLALSVQHRGPRTRAMDVAVACVLRDRWTYRRDDVEAFWRRLLVPGQALRATAVDAVAHRQAPDVANLLLAYFGELYPTPRDMDGEEANSLRLRVLDALRYQPAARVEPTLLDVALDPHAAGEERAAAIRGLLDRLSPAGRWRIMHWLGWPLPDDADAAGLDPATAGEGANDDPLVHWGLARAVGRGGGAALARALLRALDRELEAWLAAQPPERAGVETRRAARLAQREAEQRLQALARGVAETHDDAAVTALLARVFDGRIGRVATTRMAGLRATLAEGRGSPLAPRPLGVVREDGVSLSHDLRMEEGWPQPAGDLLGQAKVLGDERLASLVDAAVEAALLDGGLAWCPDAYITMAIANLLYAPTGRRPTTARRLLDVLDRLAPGEGGVGRVARLQWQEGLINERRFAEALVLARDDVHGLLHRQLVEPEADRILWSRFHVLALEAAVHEDRAEAAALHARALTVAPDRPDPLNTVAWYLRETGGDLAEAERLVRRAMRLEAREDQRASLEATDTLAMILLDRGEAARAAALLEERIHMADKSRTGIYHLHLAEIEAACGDAEASWSYLVEALRRDPASADAWRALPWVTTLEAAHPGMDAALAAAQADPYEER